MKNSLLILFFYPVLLLGQIQTRDTTVILESQEIYVLSYEVDSIVFVSKELPCAQILVPVYGGVDYYVSDQFYLVKGHVDSVLYIPPDTSIYKKDFLMQVEYMLTIKPPQIGKTYTVLADNSSSRTYLTWRNEIELKEGFDYMFNHIYPYLAMFYHCPKHLFLYEFLYNEIHLNELENDMKNPYEAYILSTYSKTGASLVLDEQMLYGSDLLGVWKPYTSTSLSNPGGLLQNNYPNFYSRKIGDKQYSIKDHLGNVRVTFADVKIPANGQLLDFYTETQSVSTYYPFGWEVKPLSWAFESFKFGYNNKEKDGDIGDWIDYGERMYLPKIARFPIPDPIIVYEKKYPELSTYQYASNRPIDGIDLDGLEHLSVTYYNVTSYKSKLGTEVFRLNKSNSFVNKISGADWSGYKQINIFIYDDKAYRYTNKIPGYKNYKDKVGDKGLDALGDIPTGFISLASEIFEGPVGWATAPLTLDQILGGMYTLYQTAPTKSNLEEGFDYEEETKPGKKLLMDKYGENAGEWYDIINIGAGVINIGMNLDDVYGKVTKTGKQINWDEVVYIINDYIDLIRDDIEVNNPRQGNKINKKDSEK